jgi:2-oxoglutarate dehydrogenase E1 component
VEQFVMGTGRLNILANIFGKSTQDIFGELKVKITIKNILTVMLSITDLPLINNKNRKKININLAPNPSHLETVGAVIEGITRAKQDKYFPNDFQSTYCSSR